MMQLTGAPAPAPTPRQFYTVAKTREKSETEKSKLVKGACLDNVASAANCVVAERYFRYICDRRMWRYGITYSRCSALLQIAPGLWR
jgi:hypothetical protein